MKLFANDGPLRAAGDKMKHALLAAVVPAVAMLSALPQRGWAEDGVAVAIVYDTSGSMKELVKDADGKSSPKYVIANRALTGIAREIKAFSTNTAAGPRKIEAGVFIFNGESAIEAVSFGPFDEAAIESWAKGFSKPQGNTPLGNALTVANRALLKSSLSRKHILVITDGINTIGPRPEQVLPHLKQQAEKKGASLGVHFVAFDVDAKVFEPLKKQGATVVGAVDEKQLDTQLQFILQKKILLEDEEPKKP